MLAIIAAVVMAAGAFALVGYPMLRERRNEDAGVVAPDEYQLALEDLTSQRDATYSAIKELDFDQEMGNLPDADYRELRERYRRKAATILKELDELQESARRAAVRFVAASREAGREGSADDEIEREIMRRRRARRQLADRRICSLCGSPNGPRDKFCRGCGTPIAAGCPHCGAAHHVEDRFCVSCGKPLEVAAR